jgi:hypothetical protein
VFRDIHIDENKSEEWSFKIYILGTLQISKNAILFLMIIAKLRLRALGLVEINHHTFYICITPSQYFIKSNVYLQTKLPPFVDF